MRKLHVITARANPFLYKTPQAIYERWVSHILEQENVELTVVELQYGDRPVCCKIDHPRVKHIEVRANSVLWSKENLINVGIAHNPEAKYFAWIDSDIFFREREWAKKAVEALQFHPIIQPWKHCYDLGPNNEHMQLHESFCSLYYEGKEIKNGHEGYTFAHPGYAWAATRDALDKLGGLIDFAILGSGDQHMAMSLIGKCQDSYPGNIEPTYKEAVSDWQHRALTHLHKNLGYLKGTIEHCFHGSKRERYYQSRWEILVKNKYNPYRDIKKNVYGMYELTGSKPELQRDILKYFSARNEDSNQA